MRTTEQVLRDDSRRQLPLKKRNSVRQIQLRLRDEYRHLRNIKNSQLKELSDEYILNFVKSNLTHKCISYEIKDHHLVISLGKDNSILVTCRGRVVLQKNQKKYFYEPQTLKGCIRTVHHLWVDYFE
jgi:hypothetical protein